MSINRVGTVSVFVSDQDRAKAFYTDVLGMELRADEPLFPGASSRWLSVAPPNADTEIVLYLLDENWEHYRPVLGQSQALTLDVTDLEGLYEALTSKGVTFTQAPEVQAWGTYAVLQDSEGNRLLLVQQPRG